jgi:hypothetical protein
MCLLDSVLIYYKAKVRIYLSLLIIGCNIPIFIPSSFLLVIILCTQDKYSE